MYEADAAADARGQAGGRQGAAPERGHQPDTDGGPGRAVLTHASWFSGVGGTDLGLEAAGWRTVSFSEIDPYASAVLERHWPGVPNLGDIVRLDRWDAHDSEPAPDAAGRDGTRHRVTPSDTHWTDATLWSGGFPCQDLSVAGKRRGMGSHSERADTRSGLAYAFLDLVERHRPPLILLENVPGLLSSNGGADLLALVRRLVELRYGWAFRVLDAQFFGVPQRRRRVYIVALRCGDDDPDGRVAAERAGQILAVSTGCFRDHSQERQARAQTAGGTGASTFNASAKFGAWDGPDDAAGTLSQRDYKSSNHLVVDGAPPDADRMRATDGLAGRPHGGAGVEDPLGLDSHRYRCCGNGVVAPVAEWLGWRLRRYVEEGT